MHTGTFSCHEINLEKGTHKGNLKNVDFCSYLGMNPHFFGNTVL